MSTAPLSLVIDVDCELARLAEVAAPWQMPAELVRRALAGGAGAVDVRLGRHLRVRAATSMAADVLPLVSEALDRAVPAVRRHAVVRDLEERGELAWLWALRWSRGLTVRSGGPNGWRVRLRPDGRMVGPEPMVDGAPGLEIIAERPRRRRAARQWLRHACALAPVPVHLDGRLVSVVRLAPLSGAVDQPLPVRLGFGGEGGACRLWLLQHGVLGGLASVPGWPPFVAAVELGGTVRPHAPAAELRQSLRPYLPAVLEQAVILAVRSAPLLEGAEPELIATVQDVLLAAERLGVRREEAAAARAFAWVGPTGVEWRGLAELRAAATAGELRVVAEPRRIEWDDQGAVVLLPRSWAPVGEQLGVRITVLEGESGAGVAERLRSWWERLPHGLAGAPLPPHLVQPAEAALARAVEARGRWRDGGRLEVELTTGAGSPRRRRGRFALPRQHQLVRAAAAALQRRPELADAVALALLGPYGRLADEAENAAASVPVVGRRIGPGSPAAGRCGSMPNGRHP